MMIQINYNDHVDGSSSHPKIYHTCTQYTHPLPLTLYLKLILTHPISLAILFSLSRHHWSARCKHTRYCLYLPAVLTV